MTAQFKKFLFLIAGLLSVAVGAIGAFVPLLPTVPFLLLAAYFFSKSSTRFHNWLFTNRWFGTILRNYKEGRGIPLRAKMYSILLLWIVFGYSLLQVIQTTLGKIIMLLVGIGVTIHLLMLKSYSKAENKTHQQQ